MCQHCDPQIEQLFKNNQAWVEEVNQNNPHFYESLVEQQTPEYLWIGCSDSRVPANELVKMDPGTIFVHRNIANLVNSSDMNVLSVIQYAVETLKVKYIIVNGHYGCGGVSAAMQEHNPDLIDYWIRPIRKFMLRAQKDFETLDEAEQLNKLCEINVVEQVRNICHIPAVRNAWKKGHPLSIHGFIYDIHDGKLHDLEVSVHNLEQADKILISEHKLPKSAR